MDDNAAVCVKCGVAKGQGDKFCHNCGEPAQPGAAFCPNCGAAFNNIPAGAAPKSKLTAGLLGLFLGGFGVHNFYLGYTGKAIAQIVLTFFFGIGAIWGFIEGILILVCTINNDADGIQLRKNM